MERFAPSSISTVGCAQPVRRRRRVFGGLVVGAVLAAGMLGAGVASAAPTGHSFSDPAGDARDSLGGNQPTADLLQLRVVSDGTSTLTLSDVVAQVDPSSRVFYRLTVGTGAAQNYTSLLSEVNNGSAVLTVGAGCNATCDYDFALGTVAGLATYGAGTGLVQASYPLADINALLTANGLAPLAPGSRLAGFGATTQRTGGLLGTGAASDFANDGGTYTLGS